MPSLIPDPFDVADRLLCWLLLGVGWLLEQSPPPLVFSGYIFLAVWLTGCVIRHVRPVPINVGHPMFQQPGGGLVWFGTGSFRLLLIFGAAITAGLSLPQVLANNTWHDPHVSPAGDGLGAMGRLSELVGFVCGGIIGYRCQYQLNLLFVVGGIGYGLIHVARWVLAG